jgi:general secretion pathway protein L
LKESLKRLAAEIQTTVFAFKSDSLDEQGLDFCFGGVVGSIPDCARSLAQFLDVEPSDCNWLSMQSISYLEEKMQPWPKGLFDDALALVFGVGKERKQFNFRKDEFSWTGGAAALTKTWGYGLITALVLVVAFVAYQVFDFYRLTKEGDQLTTQIADVYVKTVQGAQPGRDPLSELKVKVNQLKETAAAGTVHDPAITAVKLLADISERIPQSMQLSFERFIYDQDTVRIRGVTDNFNTVDQVKKTLEKSPYFSLVAIGSANVAPKENGVRFELKLQL